MDSQTAQVYEWLASGKTLTPLQALQNFGCLRLSARIHDLREIGVQIMTFKEQSIGKNGRKKSYAKYAMKGAKNE